MHNHRAGSDARVACVEFEDSAIAAIAALVRDGVLVCGSGGVVHANEVAAALLGREGDAGSLFGARLPALLYPPPEATDGSPQIAKVLGLRSERRVEVRSCRVGDWDMHVLVDLDEPARPQPALVETTQDPSGSHLETAALRARLDAEVEERRELIGVVAHELRTPITVIRGYTRLLLAGEVGALNTEQTKFIEASSKSCDRIDDFVGMLLRATDVERAADTSRFADASLAKLLAGAVDFMRPLIDESGMSVELELDPDALWAHFDAQRIEQVVVNLISNGLKYAREGRLLTIRTRPAAAAAGDATPRVEVSISDRGPGVGETARAAIFDAYVRGDQAAGVPGLGLGLAICRRIVEAHGGSIAVREEDAGGCRFAFTLARAEPKDPVEHPESGNRGDQ